MKHVHHTFMSFPLRRWKNMKKFCSCKKKLKWFFPHLKWSKSVSYFWLSESFVFFRLFIVYAATRPSFPFSPSFSAVFWSRGVFEKLILKLKSVLSRFPLPFQFPPYFRSFAVNLREWCIRMMKSREFPVSVSCESNHPHFEKKKTLKSDWSGWICVVGLLLAKFSSLRTPEWGKFFSIIRGSCSRASGNW